jgi:hypothetical protein
MTDPSSAVTILLITGTFALFTKLIDMIYKSKCAETDCCCIHVIRDIEAEEREDAMKYKEKKKKGT